MTLSPLTITPVSAVLAVQPTPLPWSARQAQMSSRMTLSLFTTRLVVALPGVAPPMRKNTSLSVVGSAGSLLCAFGVPTSSSTGEFIGPASNISPASLTPGTSATVIATSPLVGTSVGKPRPSTTVSGALDLDRLVELVDAGREDAGSGRDERVVDRLCAVRGLAMKKSSIGMDEPGVGPLPHVVPAELRCTAGTKTL